MEIKAYIYHKKAEKYSDCQDYFEISPQNNRIAVSDGMSQSIYPQWWAEILVNSYIENGKIPKEDVLISCQNEWQKKLNDEVDRREDAGMNPWRLKNAIAEKSGAGATLCGLTCHENKWTCECIGDSCLMIIKKDYSLKICTSQKGDFGNNPDYFDSFRTGRGQSLSFEGDYESVRLMLVASDPFTELFQRHANDSEFIEIFTKQLSKLSSHETFVKLVEKWRDEYQMHDDDSTIVIIDNFESREFEISHEDNLAELSKNGEISVQQNERINSKEKELLSMDGSSIENKDNNADVLLSDVRNALRKLFDNSYSGKIKKNNIFVWLKKIVIDPLIKELIGKNNKK